MHTGEMTMQYKILASDYDNTLMPFGEAKPRPAVVKAVKKLQAAGGQIRAQHRPFLSRYPG